MTAATDYKIADADDPILKCPWKIYPYFGVFSHIHVVPNNINFVYLLLSPILQFGIRFIKTLYLFRRGWKLMSWIHLQSNILEYIILNYRSLTPSHEPEHQLKKYQEIQMVDMSLSYRLTFLLHYSVYTCFCKT